jgi:hypothetical protein
MILARLPRSRRATGRRVAVVAALAAALPFAAATTSAQQPPVTAAKSVRAPNCSLKGDTTIKASRDARIFKQVNRYGYGKVYGCRRSADRAYELGYIGECQNNEEIQLAEVAGRRALLGIFECSLYAGWWKVALVNLGTGRREFASAPIGSPSPNEATFDALRRIVVASDGAAAWTATRSAGGVTSAIEVRRRWHGSSRFSILLDSGTDIDGDSLRKRGRTLSWTKAGARRTATF